MYSVKKKATSIAETMIAVYKGLPLVYIEGENKAFFRPSDGGYEVVFYSRNAQTALWVASKDSVILWITEKFFKGGEVVYYYTS